MVYDEKVDSKKSPFLQAQKPVSLTTACEVQALPDDDELNFKSLTMSSKEQIALEPPVDKWKICFLIFFLNGLGTLMPWHMFITAKAYFVEFKLGGNSNNATSNITTVLNITTHAGTDTTSTYATNFLSYIGFAAQIPNLLFNWLNIFVNMGDGNMTKRIVYSIFIEIVIFIITVILAMLDTSAWPGAFFWITMICVVILNMADAIYQNTMFGMAATLPSKYTGGVVLGSNMCGLFASIISILSDNIFSSKRTSAIYFFTTAILVLLLCLVTYFALPLNKYYRYHKFARQKKCDKQQVNVTGRPPYWAIFVQASPQFFNIFFTFFVTLSVFPAVHSDIKRFNDDFIITDKLFTSVTCFLTFNLFAMLGTLTTTWIRWPSPKYLSIPVILRVIVIPLFLFCNYQPKGINRTLPVYITNEWAYWIIAIIISYTSGYLSSLGMMYAPKTVAPNHQITVGMFAAAMVITGIFSGILFSFVFPLLVANVSF